MSKINYCEKIDEYNKNPNICKYCGMPILAKYEDKLANIKKKKFCNSSCSASYNNKGVSRNKNGKSENLSRIGSISYIEYFTDDEILEIYNNSNSFLEFSQKLGYKNYIDKSNKKIMEKLRSLGITLDKEDKFYDRRITYVRKTCSNCGKEIDRQRKTGLCYECYIKELNDNKLKNWLLTGDSGCIIGANIRGCIREYIYNDQNNKCAICGMNNVWNEKELKFILDHIDGNAANNKRENLRLICPNCDSQLDTYKSKNKNSARNYRRKYYEEYKNPEINNEEYIEEKVS